MLQSSLSEFADKINEIIPTIMREFARRQVKELCKGRITLPQLLNLEFLYTNGESTMTTLAHSMQVSTAAMTGSIDRLVKYGYCVRVFDPQDRRIIKIKLTGRGSELVKRINQQRRAMVIDIFGRISQAEREDYLRILTHIRDILTKEKGKSF